MKRQSGSVYLKQALTRQDDEGCFYVLPAGTELLVLGESNEPWQPEKLFVRAHLEGGDYFYTEPFNIYANSVTYMSLL